MRVAQSLQQEGCLDRNIIYQLAKEAAARWLVQCAVCRVRMTRHLRACGGRGQAAPLCHH